MTPTFLTRHGFAGQLRAVLFDMDGVLYDSMPNHATSWVRAAAAHGLRMTRQTVYLNEGRTGSGTVNALAMEQWGRPATPEECQAIYRTKSDIFNQCPAALPMPGAADALAAVAQLGAQRLIVTGSGQQSLLDRLNADYPGVFTRHKMVTAMDVTQGKPWPEPYLKGLQKAAVPACEAVVVENAPLGVRAAVAAGIFTVAVNTGPLPDEVLSQAGANIVLPSMSELARLLRL